MLATLGGRGWVHLRHPYDAHGYDGWYYVLQVRSLLDGAPRFADDSWAFVPMVGAAWVAGDEALGIAGLVVVVAGVVTALSAWVGARLGGPWSGATAAWIAATSTGHLALSTEFLKNELGVVPVLLLLGWLAGEGALLRRALGGLVLVALAGLTHKLCGVLALGVLGAWLVGRTPGRRRWLPVVALVGVGLLAAGTLRAVDLQRGLDEVTGGRWARVRASDLVVVERLELVALHLAPLALPLLWLDPRRRGPWGLVAAWLVVVGLAPGLPFDFESLAWRLMCVGFIGLVVLVGLFRPPPSVALGLCGLLAASAPPTVASHGRRGPDYPAWRDQVPVVQRLVPEQGSMVAHRGLCGFLWAVGQRRCENFEPEGDGEGVWRVAWGVDAAWIAPYGEVHPLRPGYVLVEEGVWRRYRADQGPRSLVWSARNPHEPRPAWVYGPREP